MISNSSGRSFTFFLAVILVAGMLPWLQWRESRFPDAKSDVGFGLTWQVADQVMAPVQVQPPEIQPAFVRDFGGDTFCRFQQRLCRLVAESESVTSSPWNIYDSEGFSNSEMKQLVVGAVAANLPEVIAYKIGKLVNVAWTDTSIFGVAHLLLFTLVGGAFLSFRWCLNRILFRQSQLELASSAIGIYLMSTTLFVIAFGHLEARYLLPIVLANPILWYTARSN